MKTSASLAEVNDADTTERVMVAITYREIDDLTQTDTDALYGFSSSWASEWISRLERPTEWSAKEWPPWAAGDSSTTSGSGTTSPASGPVRIMNSTVAVAA